MIGRNFHQKIKRNARRRGIKGTNVLVLGKSQRFKEYLSLYKAERDTIDPQKLRGYAASYTKLKEELSILNSQGVIIKNIGRITIYNYRDSIPHVCCLAAGRVKKLADEGAITNKKAAEYIGFLSMKNIVIACSVFNIKLYNHKRRIK